MLAHRVGFGKHDLSGDRQCDVVTRWWLITVHARPVMLLVV